MQSLTESLAFPVAREKVRHLLSQSQAFRSLPKEKQRELAHDMVLVATYITGGETGDSIPLARRPLSRASADDPAGETAGGRMDAAGGAVAAEAGTASYQELVQTVDFPKFVAGLIDGVFNAIVTSSIKQMEAYADLVKNVVKSVEEYMKDNVTENNARDYLAGRYPDYLEVDTEGEQPQLKPKEGHDEDNLPDFFKDLGLSSPVTGLDEDTVEQQLVPAARKRMAMDRQQLLATMVLMGINRLIVTDGSISASVLFQLDTKDDVSRHYNRASDYERNRTYTRTGEGQEGAYAMRSSGDSWRGNWYSGNYTYSRADTANFKVSTTQSEDSNAKVETHAKLTGKVDLRFRSDVFPLERMADMLQMNEIRQKASTGTPAGQPGGPEAAAGAPAPSGATAPAR